MTRSALFLGALAALLLAACDGFLYQEPTTDISKNEALADVESARSALYGAYNLTMRDPDAYRGFLTYYADLTGGNARVNPGLASETETELRRIAFFNSLSDQTADAYTALYEILNAVNNVINAAPSVPDGSEQQKGRILGQTLGLRALLHFDLVRLYAQPYTHTEDAGHPGIVVLTKSPRPDEERARSTVADAYAQIIEDLERSIELLEGEAFDPAFVNAVNAKALLSRVYLYQQEWAKVVTLASEVISNEATSLAPAEDLVAMWQNGYTGHEFLLRLDGSAYSAYTLSADWGNRSAETRPVLSATADAAALYDSADVRGEGTGKLIQTTLDRGDTLLSSLKYPEPPTQAPNNVGVIRLSEVYLNRTEAYANLGRPQQARADVNAIRQRANPAAAPVRASGQELLDAVLLERRKELAFEGHLLYDRTRYGNGVDRDYCAGAERCSMPYPSPHFVLPIPLDALVANGKLTQNEGY